ncbi:family 16 glycosylhydrolase [Thalassotalea ponticola]|uniref:family 16 glycosylhydrolase n=1 Tax=Thalassotalea ponticola TaxID=1523392 RepID=UPI0025B3B05B|nr:family 16 glycosylhydrolase [Thalassotalea ponticola]MDN3651599.1 family 16 glycosylhydrolase [Thalassotalea ponticola]
MRRTKLTMMSAVMGASFIGLTGCVGDSLDADVDSVLGKEPPYFTSQAMVEAKEGQEYVYTIGVDDEDSVDLTISADTLPSWLTFDSSTNTLRGTPSVDDIGEHVVVISVTDGESTRKQEFVIIVVEGAGDWVMVWSDEFDGTSLNADNWNVETGDGSQYGLVGWGNNELQWYQNENITVENGNLVITAKQEASNNYNYTSGRMRSDGKVDIQYGRIEARIKVPGGQGLWPAFWMLPTNSQYGGWASGGEIDIMEVFSATQDNNNDAQGTLHYGMAWPLNVYSFAKAGQPVLGDYHLFAIEWEEDEIRWYLDDLHYGTITSETWWSYYYKDQETGYVGDSAAPFNQPFHLLLNVAVGGNLPGSPNADTEFPAQMMVDYVRVYECETDPVTGKGCAANVNPEVELPAADNFYVAEYPLFIDGDDKLSWQVQSASVERALQAVVGWDNNGAISLTQPDLGNERGTVLEINTGDKGNVLINAVDGDTLSLFGMGNSARPWELHAGELKFDLFIDSTVTPDESQIFIKMDSGYPKLGVVTLNVADLKKDMWQSVSVKVNDIIATPGEQPLNTNDVLNPFIIEFSGAARVMVDNVTLKCGHKDDNGCGIAPPPINVDTETLDVFVDEVNSDIWTNGIGAWDTASGQDYFDGANGFVQWQTVAEQDRGDVLQVTFGGADADGLLYIQSGQPVDLSAFSDGSLVFDLKVLDYADTASGMSFKVDCVYPCTTGDQVLGVVADGVWETIRVPVSTLVSQGLDITSVNTGLVIYPTWGDQNNVTFMIDNIRWERTASVGVEPPVEPPVVEGDVVIFSEEVDPNWSFWDCCGGATISQQVDSDYGNVYQVDFAGPPTVAGVTAESAIDVSSLVNGTLEFDLKMLSAPTDDSAQWLLKVESSSADLFTEIALSDSNEGVDPTLGEWQHYTFSFATLESGALNLSDVKIILVFPSWSKANGASYQIDNIVFKANE